VNFSFRVRRTISGTPLVSFVVRTDDGAMPPLVGDAIRLGEWSRIEVVRADGPGAAAINDAVGRATGELVVIVDGAVRLDRGDLVRDLLPLAQDDDVAAAGPTLVSPDGTLAANGLTFAGGPRPVGHGSPADDIGPWGIYRVTREVSAVPTACFAARRDAFLDLGGLATDLDRTLAGADYGARAGLAGARILVTPFVQVTVPWSFPAVPSDGARREWVERWGADDDDGYSPFGDRPARTRVAAAR
jgi:hypothetical protein